MTFQTETLQKKLRKKKGSSLKNEVLVQHNNLMEARYRLSLQEKRVILWLISQIQPDDEDFKIHTINIQKFCQLAGVESKNMYREIEKVTMRLIQRGLSIRNLEEGSLTQVCWLSSAKYLYDEGLVELRFSPHMQPFLLNLKQQFTKLTLSDVMQLHSIYSVRLYELLKQYESLKRREISLIDLREYCGISKEEYKRYNDFKRKVIEKALQEINEKTDISFRFQEVKRSRKIVSIIFHVCKNQNYTPKKAASDQGTSYSEYEIANNLQERERLINILISYGFSKKSTKLMSQDLSDSEFREALNAVEVQINRGNVRNIKAMVRTALQKKWGSDIFSVSKKTYLLRK